MLPLSAGVFSAKVDDPVAAVRCKPLRPLQTGENSFISQSMNEMTGALQAPRCPRPRPHLAACRLCLGRPPHRRRRPAVGRAISWLYLGYISAVSRLGIAPLSAELEPCRTLDADTYSCLPASAARGDRLNCSARRAGGSLCACRSCPHGAQTPTHSTAFQPRCWCTRHAGAWRL